MRFGKNAQRSDGNMNPFERYKKKRNAVILRNIKRKVNQEKKNPPRRIYTTETITVNQSWIMPWPEEKMNQFPNQNKYIRTSCVFPRKTTNFAL